MFGCVGERGGGGLREGKGGGLNNTFRMCLDEGGRGVKGREVEAEQYIQSVFG